jgi:pimeloyl-ACP methyl ester carboxylesterase
MSAILGRRIPGASYHVVPGAGHMTNLEQPAVVNGLLTAFLSGLPPQPQDSTAGRSGR